MAKIREILVVPHTHHDIGYTHTPAACLDAHGASVGAAMDLCEAALDDDSPTAFRWTYELARPVLAYLECAPPAEAERMRRLRAAGCLAVTGGLLHMTQLLGHEEAIRALRPAHALRERFGLGPTIVQHGDINGLPWGTVPLMAAAGLDTLVMALNPDHGRPPFEQPSAFFWEGQDRSRVLVWLSVHYGLGRLAEGHLDKALAAFPPLLARLEERDDYPFDFLLVHAARDNMWPDPRVTAGARLWNEQGHTPPMRTVTIEAAMARARAAMPQVELPVVRGEWADWWAHGHGSSAYEVGLGRQAQTDLRLAETAHALSRIAGGAGERGAGPAGPAAPVTSWYNAPIGQARRTSFTDRITDAYDDLLLWEEHTWGSFQSVTHPFSPFAQSHWNEKAGFGYRAYAHARELGRDAVQELVATLPAASEPGVAVVNPLSRARDDVITIPTERGEVTRVVRDLPPFGIRVLPASQAAAEQLSRSTVLENRFYRIEVDPDAAAIVSVYDKELGKEWVDATEPGGLAGVVYEEADPADDHPALTESRRHFHPDTPGPRFVRTAAKGTGEQPCLRRGEDHAVLTYESAAPCLPLVRTFVTLYDDLKWIDLTVHLRKDENYRMEGVHVVFPFALDTPEFLIESTNAVFDPAAEQLPDTCRDWYSVQHAVGITSEDVGLLWATREAPLVQLGGFRTGAWAREYQPATGHIHAWLMNNLYFTNFKAAQGGELDASFRFTTSGGRIEPGAMRRWGEAFAAPAVAVAAPVALGDYRWLTVSPEAVMAQVITPPPDEPGLLIRLRETSGEATTAAVTWHGSGAVEVLPATIFGQPASEPVAGDGRRFEVPLRPHELTTILIRRR